MGHNSFHIQAETFATDILKADKQSTTSAWLDLVIWLKGKYERTIWE